MAGDSSGVWSMMTDPGAPSKRELGGLVYDPVRKRMLMLFGYDGAIRDTTVWECTLGDAPVWTELHPVGPAPLGRNSFSVVYDSARDRIIVFGGAANGVGVVNDVWALSLTEPMTWTELHPDGTLPAARADHCAIYDPVRDQMIVFSGFGASFFRDTWSLSLTSDPPQWTQVLSTESFGPRVGGGCMYDALRDRMLIIGGWDGTFVNGDIYVLSLANPTGWVRLFPTGTNPQNRQHAAVAYCPLDDRLYMFGGEAPGFGFLRDAWAINLAGTMTWSQQLWEFPRNGMRMIWDNDDARFALFGGDAGSEGGLMNDLHLFDPLVNQIMLGNPPGRWGAGMAYDSKRNRILMFEGYERWDMWAYDLTTRWWSQILAVNGTVPARAVSATIYDPLRDRLVVFGGLNPNGSTWGDTWVVDLAGAPTLTKMLDSMPAGTRQWPCTMYDPEGDRMIIFGGYHSDLLHSGISKGNLSDTWALSLDTFTWTQLSLTSNPHERTRACGVYDPLWRRFIIYGGERDCEHNCAGRRYWDTWSLSLDTPDAEWESLSVGPPPTPNRQVAAIYDPVYQRMVTFGGDSVYVLQNEAWELTLRDSIPSWFQLQPAGVLPSPRSAANVAYDPTRGALLAFSGVDGTTRVDGWQLQWTPPTVSVGPPPSSDGPSLTVVPSLLRTTTHVRFTNTSPTVRIAVYDARGRLVRTLWDGALPRGDQDIVWVEDARHRLSAGVYVVRVELGTRVASRRVVRLLH